MTSNFNTVYHALIFVTAVLSGYVTIKIDRHQYLITTMLLITFLLEVAAIHVLSVGQIQATYHIFVVIEFFCLAKYLQQYFSSKRARKIISVCIGCFTVSSLLTSWLVFEFKGLPAWNINTSGTILILLSIRLMFTLDVQVAQHIFKHQNFWFCLSLLVFFAGTFFSNFLYHLVDKTDHNKALTIFYSINQPVNLLYYSFLSISMVCSIPRKYFSRLF